MKGLRGGTFYPPPNWSNEDYSAENAAVAGSLKPQEVWESSAGVHLSSLIRDFGGDRKNP